MWCHDKTDTASLLEIMQQNKKKNQVSESRKKNTSSLIYFEFSVRAKKKSKQTISLLFFWWQVWSKDGHVDHRVLSQHSPGRGGGLPAGRQAVRSGRIWWPVVSEHCGFVRCTKQRVDRGKPPPKNLCFVQCCTVKHYEPYGVLAG